MKYCKICDKEFDDKVNFCPYCGNTLSNDEEKVNYFPNCGEELEEDMNFCPVCGEPTEAPEELSCTNDTAITANRQPVKGVGVITAFMIISCIIDALMIFVGISMISAGISGTMFIGGILPLLWKIPMTVHFYGYATNSKKLSTAFKVCTLIFVSGIAGIIMLCYQEL